MEFVRFGKIPRLSRECIITEKIDGTNSQIYIDEGMGIYAGSRNRWLTPEDDNFGFARWVMENKDELLKLGIGRHFGEWWGKGIQRGYGLTERRFSLFNTSRWTDDLIRPKCCHVVPTLWSGIFSTEKANELIEVLKQNGSAAAPGFMRPEGIIIFHTAGNLMFKKTVENDEKHKGE